jgi:ferredoxin-NADP reductase
VSALAHLLADLAGDDLPTACIAITTKAIPDGLVSNHVVRDLRPRHPRPHRPGRRRLRHDDPPPGKVLFLTGGSGITPVMGMLRNHLASCPTS